jgi:quinol monooxygenase YgiN
LARSGAIDSKDHANGEFQRFRKGEQMYSAVVTWYLKPGCRERAETALTSLAEAVFQTEKNTWGYLVHSGATGSVPPSTPDTIVFVEIYKDQAAFLAHVNGSAFQDFLKEYGDLFVSAPGAKGPFFLVQNVDRIQGFVRASAAKLDAADD